MNGYYPPPPPDRCAWCVAKQCGHPECISPEHSAILPSARRAVTMVAGTLSCDTCAPALLRLIGG